MRYEAAQEPQKFTAFDAVRNEVWTLQGAEANTPRGTFVRTLADEGADVKTQVAKGWLTKTGDTTFLGRPAIKLESAPGAPERRQHEADDRRRRHDLRAVRARRRPAASAARPSRSAKSSSRSRRCRWPTTSTSCTWARGPPRAKRVTSSQQGKAMLEDVQEEAGRQAEGHQEEEQEAVAPVTVRALNSSLATCAVFAAAAPAAAAARGGAHLRPARHRARQPARAGDRRALPRRPRHAPAPRQLPRLDSRAVRRAHHRLDHEAKPGWLLSRAR